jgi:aryl-alcohol dehydrogenase-like predicted oxidoreductase
MPLDSYVTLPHAGLRVSPLTLGTMGFGPDWGWGSEVGDCRRILDRYAELGGNSIDTANIYTNGHSEKIVGDWLHDHPGERDRIVLGTKFFGNLLLGDPNGGGAGRKALVRQLEASLRRLGTDWIDIYWIHNWDAGTPIEETLRALDDLVRDGRIRYVGISDFPAWKAAQAYTLAQWRDWAPPVAMQLEYSLAERTVEGELMPMSREFGLGVFPWGPLRGGFLTGKYRDGRTEGRATGRFGPREEAIVDRLADVAERTHTDLGTAALAWLRSRPGVTSTIIGARTVEQLDQNIASLDVDLDPADVAALDEVSRPTLNFPHDNNAAVVPRVLYAGATVDGVAYTAHPGLVDSPARY